MNDRIAFDSLLDITKNSENKVSRIALKLLYYFNCAVISIWLAGMYGYRIPTVNLNLMLIIQLISDLKIVIPVFTFLFVSFTITLISGILGQLTSYSIVRPIIKFTRMKGKSLIGHLLDSKVIDKDLLKGEEFEEYSKGLKGSYRKMKKLTLVAEYLSVVTITTLIIYGYIVRTKFPELYSAWILVFTWFWAVCFIGTLGYVKAVDHYSKKAIKILKYCKDKPSNP